MLGLFFQTHYPHILKHKPISTHNRKDKNDKLPNLFDGFVISSGAMQIMNHESKQMTFFQCHQGAGFRHTQQIKETAFNLCDNVTWNNIFSKLSYSNQNKKSNQL